MKTIIHDPMEQSIGVLVLGSAITFWYVIILPNLPPEPPTNPTWSLPAVSLVITVLSAFIALLLVTKKLGGELK